MQPLAYQGQDVVLFQLLDPQELKPVLKESALIEDMESGQTMEVSPIYMSSLYRERIDAHVEALHKSALRAGADHRLVNITEPLDERAAHLSSVQAAARLAKRSARECRCSRPHFSLVCCDRRLPWWLHRLSSDNPNKQKFSSLMFLEPGEPRRVLAKKVQYLLLLALRIGVLVLLALAFAEPAIWRTPAGRGAATARACT